MLSFVVPAYNEEKYIGATLASIHQAARTLGLDYEIVVADDASSDATAAIATQAGARVVSVAKRQISATRNAGAAAATGERLIFVDGDTRVNAPLVASAIEALAAGAVGGGARVRFESAPQWAQRFMWVFNRIYFGLFRWAAGCFVFCTRAAFEAAGGFDERHFAAEEIMLSMALKKHGRFVIVREYVETSARKIEGRTRWDLLKLMAGTLLGGLRGVRSRETTQFWYDGRR